MKAMEILKEFLRIINEEGIDWQELCEQTDLLEIYVVPSLQNLKDLESYIEGQKSKKINAWVAVDADGSEWIYDDRPIRSEYTWAIGYAERYCRLPKGSIKALIGLDLAFEDEPVELKEIQ